ncbi:MAG: type II secretion system protein [Deltaproteobacteria bacterium]|nr:type II secretion system protein [Deltaproteobacteria bacterium]
MRRHAGFTLIELMVVIAILGILGATAVQCYRTIQQRACSSEASCMVKQILDAEIMYFLQNDKFFPEVGQTIMIFHNDLPSKAEITQTKDPLKITIPVGHFLDYNITNLPGPVCMATISSYGNSFALFKDGSLSITGVVDDTGKIDML